MQRLFLVTAPLFLVFGCSALVQIDDDKYLGDGVDDVPNGDGDGGAPSGGTGSSPGDGGGGSGSGGTDAGGGTGSSGGTDSGGADSGGSGSGGAGGSGGSPSGGAGGSGPVLAPIPFHFYPLNGDTSDQGSSPLKYTAAITSTTWVPGGVLGGAFEVPAGDYLDMNAPIASTSPFTLSWWCSPTGSLTAYSLVSKGDFAQMGSAGFALTSDNGLISVRIGAADATIFSTSATHATAAEGKWTHIAFAYQENFSATTDRFTVWINGALAHEEEGVFAWSGANQNAHVRFGIHEGSPIFNPYAGLIDEVRFYESYLTDAQVSAIYDLESPD